MERLFLALSGVMGFLAVALGAFGAHGLRRRFEAAEDGVQRLGWWQTGAQYHLAHAIALGVTGLLCGRVASSAATFAGFSFLAGTLLFSGSLYVMTLTGIRKLGAVTPLGGLAFLAGWVAFSLAALSLPG